LTAHKTKFAIGRHQDYGPSFGDDFVIYNKAHHSKNCWSNFPDVYTSRTHPMKHTVEMVNALVGVRDHFEKFNLLQWEVYKISFSEEEDQEIDNTFIIQYKKIPKISPRASSPSPTTRKPSPSPHH
jgi:hypothetical protein